MPIKPNEVGRTQASPQLAKAREYVEQLSATIDRVLGGMKKAESYDIDLPPSVNDTHKRLLTEVYGEHWKVSFKNHEDGYPVMTLTPK